MQNCKHKHHTSLCKPNSEEPKTNYESDTQEKAPQPPTQAVTTLTPMSCESRQPKQTAIPTTNSLLKTAIAPISANGLQINGNTYFI